VGQRILVYGLLACEYDLALKGTRCKEKQRTTQPDSAGWIGWALKEQRHNIQGTLPINWATHFGTHNSYSSTRQGFVHVMAANQYYSITDQLQLGARFVRLDPHWYYDNSDFATARTSISALLPRPAGSSRWV
jgi:uncharacterized protein YchJ